MSPRKREPDVAADNGRFAYDGLDRAFHEKARLGILTSLVAHPDGLKFGELRTLCHRLLVIHKGRIVAEMAPSSPEETIGRTMLGLEAA